MPDTLYTDVAMSGNSSLFENAPAGGREQSFAPIIWGLLLPPAVTGISAVALLESGVVMNGLVGFRQQLTFFLFIAGMTLLCSTLLFCCLPVRSFGVRIKEFRFSLIISALATLLALVVGVSVIAEQSDGYHGSGEGLLFMPLLLGICVVPLWRSVREMAGRLMRVLTLGGFLLATVLVQFSILKSGQHYQDERVWMLNSLLVGLAFAIWLCAWSAKEFRRI